jgi:hypothetical protein
VSDKQLNDIYAAVETLCQGLKDLTAVLGHHSEMLGMILSAVAERDEDEPSPLAKALAAILSIAERNAGSLDRIEDRAVRIEALCHQVAGRP